MTTNKKDILIKVIMHILLIVFVGSVLFPLVWMASGAFKTYAEVMDMPPKLLPSGFNLDNFSKLRSYFKVEVFLGNSVIVALATMGLQIVFSIMAAYVFCQIFFPRQAAGFSALSDDLDDPISDLHDFIVQNFRQSAIKGHPAGGNSARNVQCLFDFSCPSAHCRQSGFIC
jgi:hypothetical protein